MKEATKTYFKKIIVIILTAIAVKVLKKYNPKIVAVTGNVGKTTTKDAIFAAISTSKRARKSEKSFNSEIGVPLTILGCKNAWSNPILWLQNIFIGIYQLIKKVDYPEWLILEIGADRPGDIKNISEWVNPDIAVITRLPDIPVHVEYFSSPEDFAKEKMYLAKNLKQGGTLIINADDNRLVELSKEIKNKIITYGYKNDADYLASDLLVIYENAGEGSKPSGISFEVISENTKVDLSIKGTLGLNLANSFAAAVAVSNIINVDINDVKKGLSMFINPSGRMNIVDGIKNTIIIDDTYNSSPLALESAINTMKMLNTKGRKIFVVGDMLELGAYSSQIHKNLGREMAKVGNIIVAVGLRARGFAEGALDAGMDDNNVFQYETSRLAGQEFQNIIKASDILLVKGSQGVRMERFVEEIMAFPENKTSILVRQDKEWIE